MNILFVLYGDFRSNSANPLVLYARELQSRGHKCAIAVPSNLESVALHENPAFIPVLYGDALASPASIFPDHRPADVLHACTPREVVSRFVMAYMARRPTPLVIYLEDNESWISTRKLGLDEPTLAGYSEQEIFDMLPGTLSHPFRYHSFIGLADAVAVIQDKLMTEVPPWVHCTTVMIGVDIDFFSPRPRDISLQKKFGIADDERVIVYHGGLDQFKSPAIEDLCKAVELVNRRGISCRLLRTGPGPLRFLEQWPHKKASAITDLGVLPRRELPDLLSLADVLVQPGQVDPFEDLRLPGKIPEFLAMGRPVILPNANIAHLFRDGFDAVILRTGDAEEIALKCVELFSDPQRAARIGQAGRVLAEKYFDVRSQARLLDNLYKTARNKFNFAIASEVWKPTDENAPIALMLARKLRLLADLHGAELRFEASGMLREHARYIELTQRRLRGLEERIASLLSSKSWRINRPLRYGGKNSRLATLMRFGSHCLSRGRAWYVRHGRLPRFGELSSLLRLVLVEYQIRFGWRRRR